MQESKAKEIKIIKGFEESTQNSPNIFLSPLKKVKKFENYSKVQENPYQNGPLSANLISKFEQLQKSLSLSSSSSENCEESSESDKNDLNPKNLSNAFSRTQVREPSFGFEGGNFSLEESQSSELKMLIESAKHKFGDKEKADKAVQTDKKTEMEELFTMISDKEFINSLKVIGQFARFLEGKCKN